jgi:DNA polymerase I-like protein with 3'-5' exonuclease and polymerase domains
LTLVATLGKWEIEGVPTDINRLSDLRKELLNECDSAKMALTNSAGVIFDPDAEEELGRILLRDGNIANSIGFRKVTFRVIEYLSVCYTLPRLIVKYRRVLKQLRHLEGIIRAVQNFRVYPVFNQASNDYGQLTAVRPRLFEDFGHTLLSSCFEESLSNFFSSSQRSLDIVQDLSEDDVLQNDRLAAGASRRFLKTEVALDDVDQEDLLLSTMIGMSNEKLCKRFLYKQSVIASIRHDFEVRYCKSYRWLEEYRKQTMKRGFALDCERRRWFDGLRSSDIAKRERAVNSAVRWLLRY